MKIGTILLTKSHKYVDDFGNLPVRPDFDKKFLANFIEGGLVSERAFNLLPPSLKKLVKIGSNSEINTAIKIKELAECDLLVVVKSPKEIKNGKTFRLNKFKLLIEDTKIEIWKRK